MTIFDGFNVFFRFLVEICLRTPIKPPQKASSRPKVQIPYHLHPALSYSLRKAPDSPSSACTEGF